MNTQQAIVTAVDMEHCGTCKRRLRGAMSMTYGDPQDRSRVTKVTCDHCIEWVRIQEYNRDKILTSRIIMSASLYAISLEYRKPPGELGTDFRDWKRQICSLRSVPPDHVPESRWPEFKGHMDAALDEVERGETTQPEFEKVGLNGLGIVATLERVMVHIQRAHGCGVFEGTGHVRRLIPQPRTYKEVHAAVERVTEVMKKEYEPAVWFGGLQAFVRAALVCGHSAVTPELKFLSMCSAGRALQTLSFLSKPDESITLIADETSEEPRMGIQGIDTTEENAIALLRAAAAAWKAGEIKLDDDRKVSLF